MLLFCVLRFQYKREVTVCTIKNIFIGFRCFITIQNQAETRKFGGNMISLTLI